jgi:membrane protein DedA with SNARE-associated domain
VLNWLAGLPPGGIYGALALLAALENIFPPVPADTAVALGAFLAARDAPISVVAVYLVTLVANVTSAIGMYAVARTVGRSFLESRTGRRLLSARSQAALERTYQRHHLWGIFVSRFLPGYRAVVPPFAGMIGLPASQALPPMVLASAAYYGLLVWGAHRIGRNWEAVVHWLGHVTVALAIATVVASVALGWLLWRARHRRSADGR